MEETRGQPDGRRELGTTEVPRAVARILVGAFCLSLVVPPLLRPGGRPLAPLGAFAAELPTVARLAGAGRWGAANAALRTAMERLESDLDEGSRLRREALPTVQWLLTRWGGVGNERVYVGRRGWLFYRPGFDYVTGPAFPPDEALAALLDFRRQLAARGVGLLLLPTPTKAMVLPERLAPGARERGAALHNPSFPAFRQRLEAAGVVVVDPVDVLVALAADGREPFLRTDSHWSPAAVDAVAHQLAERLGEMGLPPAVGTPTERSAVQITGRGDLLRMLRLPPGGRLFAGETVVIQQLETATGDLWRSDPAADVLLLGDSFSNVFSLPDLGWGRSAGLAEQLAYHLRRPVDRLAVNDGGAAGARERLAQELAAGRDRLAGKRVVVHQVAVRELSRGGWRVIPLSAPEGATPPEARTHGGTIRRTLR